MLSRGVRTLVGSYGRQRVGASAPRLLRAQRDLNTLFPITAVSAESAATAVAAKPLVAPAMASFLSVSPAIAAQILFLSPMQAMRQFRADGTTGAVSVMPYAAMAANGASWTTYGALSGDFTIMIPNFSGLVLGSYYCQQFYTHRAPDATVLPYFGGAVGFVTAVLGAAATLPTASAQTFIGYAGCTLTALMFVGPLAAIQTVMRDRSAASLPLAFTLASTANCAPPLTSSPRMSAPRMWAVPAHLHACRTRHRLLVPTALTRGGRHAVDVVRLARHPRPLRVGTERRWPRLLLRTTRTHRHLRFRPTAHRWRWCWC
jgi:hypothetical protein